MLDLDIELEATKRNAWEYPRMRPWIDIILWMICSSKLDAETKGRWAKLQKDGNKTHVIPFPIALPSFQANLSSEFGFEKASKWEESRWENKIKAVAISMLHLLRILWPCPTCGMRHDAIDLWKTHKKPSNFQTKVCWRSLSKLGSTPQHLAIEEDSDSASALILQYLCRSQEFVEAVMEKETVRNCAIKAGPCQQSASTDTSPFSHCTEHISDLHFSCSFQGLRCLNHTESGSNERLLQSVCKDTAWCPLPWEWCHNFLQSFQCALCLGPVGSCSLRVCIFPGALRNNTGTNHHRSWSHNTKMLTSLQCRVIAQLP